MSRPGVNKSLKQSFIKVILTKNQGRSKRNKEGVRIRKSRCIESIETCCYTGKFNISLSLCRVLGFVLYFSKGFLEVATRNLVATETLWPLEVTVVCCFGAGV